MVGRGALIAVDFPGGGGGDGVGPTRWNAWRSTSDCASTSRTTSADELGKKRYMEFMPWHFGFSPVSPAPGERVRRDGSLPSAAADETRGGGRGGGDGNAAELALERVLRCESEEARVMLSEALWDARGRDPRRGAVRPSPATGIWNDGRRKGGATGGVGDGDRAMGGETPSEDSQASREKDESGVAGEGCVGVAEG